MQAKLVRLINERKKHVKNQKGNFGLCEKCKKEYGLRSQRDGRILCNSCYGIRG